MSQQRCIQSPRNPRLKNLMRLREHRGRLAARRCLVEDMASLRAAARCGVEPVEVYVWPKGLSPAAKEWLDGLGDHIPVTLLNEACRRKIALGDDCTTPVAVFPLRAHRLKDHRLEKKEPVAVVLDRVEKPGNIGAVLRTADALGVDVVVLCDCPTDPGNPHLIRAARGAFFSNRWVVAGLDELAPWLKENGFSVVTARPRAECSLVSVDMGRKTAFVIGREDVGLRDEWDALGATACRVPMCGVVDSLNASVTAAILMYEACRRRGRLNGTGLVAGS